MSPPVSENFFAERTEKWQAVLARAEKKLARSSVTRLLVFFGTAAGVVLLATQSAPVLLVIITGLAGALGFAWLVKQHNRLTLHKKICEQMVAINQDEQGRYRGEQGRGPGGNEYLEPKHAYALDLDVFGEFSLFKMLDRCATVSGRKALAHWLVKPAGLQEIQQRQQAVTELAPLIDWRQELQANGKVFDHPDASTRMLLNWLDSPDPLGKNRRNYQAANYFMPLLALAGVVFYLMHGNNLLYALPLGVVLLVNMQIIKRLNSAAEDVLFNTYYNVGLLKSFRGMIALLEPQQFNSPLLQQLQAKFRHKDFVATHEINKLERILESFQQRGSKKIGVGGNVFYYLLNIFFLIDIHWLLKAENWKKNARGDISGWFDSLGAIEAVCSLAGFAFANPGFAMPEVTAEPYIYRATQMGHPLLERTVRVNNSFELAGKGRLAMITGSNMAGKSTFLRTVGVNMVLALAGAPVCATEMEVSTMRLFTSMRTQDSLEESLSAFYAELSRLRQLLELIRSGEPVLFMLDELLKGTNSEDRHKGAVSLIRQLGQINSFGIISTHDLELSRMANEHTSIKNYSFNSRIEGEEIIFDYQLDEGICRGFNASLLMKKIGIDIQD